MDVILEILIVKEMHMYYNSFQVIFVIIAKINIITHEVI